MVIDDATSFYTAIKSNPLYSFEIPDDEIIHALDEVSRKVFAAADVDFRRGAFRDRYIYFQAMIDGMRLQHRMWLQHLRVMNQKNRKPKHAAKNS